MKIIIIILVSAVGILLSNTVDARTDPLCKPLRKFLESINPDEKRSVEFHTIWGEGFKDIPSKADSDRITIASKRCIDQGYAPATVLCQSLMENGAMEFSNMNAQSVITCLSPKTQFGLNLKLERFFATFSYGTPNRGSNVEITFGENSKIGGMSLKIEADGY